MQTQLAGRAKAGLSAVVDAPLGGVTAADQEVAVLGAGELHQLRRRTEARGLVGVEDAAPDVEVVVGVGESGPDAVPDRRDRYADGHGEAGEKNISRYGPWRRRGLEPAGEATEVVRRHQAGADDPVDGERVEVGKLEQLDGSSVGSDTPVRRARSATVDGRAAPSGGSAARPSGLR